MFEMVIRENRSDGNETGINNFSERDRFHNFNKKPAGNQIYFGNLDHWLPDHKVFLYLNKNMFR